jgi:ClpP class serine protease
MRIPTALLAPWAITSEGLQLVLSVYSRGEWYADARQKALQERDGEPLKNAHATTVRKGVAIIPVYGPLFRHASLFTAISGATSYEDVRKDFQKALEDPGVSAIVLDVNSPGGEADGCGELADAIYAARGIKPIVAYVGGMGCSAAYWIGSAAGRIVASPSAIVGSIGVRSAVIDDSERDKREGVRSVEIISSRAPNKRDLPVDDAVIAKAQRICDDLEDVFIERVTKTRPPESHLGGLPS